MTKRLSQTMAVLAALQLNEDLVLSRPIMILQYSQYGKNLSSPHPPLIMHDIIIPEVQSKF